MNQDQAFCPELYDLLTTNRAIGASGKVYEGVTGHSTQNNLFALRALMRHLKAERTLETGFAFGGSCLQMTATHREMGHAPARQHVAIDPLQATMFDSCGLVRLAAAGLEPYLDFRGESSSLALPQLVREGRRFDLIYIDGSHVFEGVLIDTYYSTRLLREGGIMAFDDSSLDQVAKVLKFIRRNQKHCLEEIDLSPFRPDDRSARKWRIARALGRAQLIAFGRRGEVERNEWHIPLRQF